MKYIETILRGLVADNVQGAIDEVVGNVEQKLQSIVNEKSLLEEVLNVQIEPLHNRT